MSIESMSDAFFSGLFKADNGCLEFTGSRNRAGYGLMKFGGRLRVATHVAWYLKHGYFPGKLYVCHKCDNPPCCNPDHLFLGTAKDNMQDCIAKGRMPSRKDKNTKISEADAQEIRRLCDSRVGNVEIGKRFGVSPSTVSRVYHRSVFNDGAVIDRKPNKQHCLHKDATRIEFCGRDYHLSELSEETGVSRQTLLNRYRAGLRGKELLQRKPYSPRS